MENQNTMIAVVAVIAVVLVAGFFWMKSSDEKMMMNDNNEQAMVNDNDNDSMMDENSNMDEDMDNKMAMEKGVMVGGAMMVPSKDIVDNAVNSKDHTTLVAAVKAAGLVETLKGDGPFTVFAPTNAAFAKLPAGTVDKLVMPESKDMLTSILTYHVVPGAYKSSDLKDGMTLKTVNGQNLTFTEKDGAWWINGTSKIEIADVVSTNGVTYVIDTVLMPK
jgi:uncharacterized surface protein with fasciclin (FAS1) repeats